MATEAQLIAGLKAADAAGNTVDAQHFADQIKAMRTSSAPAEDGPAPRWDIMGDIGHSAEGAVGAVTDDANAAFPDPKTMDLGPVATLARMGSALKLPLDALGAVASPITGAIHGTLGSALSYVMPTTEKDTETAGQMFYSDPKKAADQVIDSAMMGLGPRGMGSPSNLGAASAAREANTTARAAAKLKNRAAAKVSERAIADGLTPQQVNDAQKAANANGDKVTLMDLGNKNVRGLAGAVHRAPGPAGKQIGDFLGGRDTAASGALTQDIQGSVAKGSTYNATQDLINARSSAAKQPFADAYASDSTAPFEQQLSSHLSKATGAKGQIAKQIKDIETNNPGALAARGAAGKDVRDRYMALREQLEQAESDRQSTLGMFKRAQEDRLTNTPGAVWSPRLQEFMDHPDVKAGIQHGLKLEKQDAISERRPFKDSDYGITGWDEKGDPIVSAVPTMKQLAAAKEGLDARILEMVDPNTRRLTKAGLSLKKFRNAFVGELDTLNPKYKTARDVWGGPSQSMEAVRDGREHFSRADSNEQLKAEFDALSPADKDFYRLGAAEAKVDQLERAPDASDKSKRVINSERDRKRFRILFGSDAEADKFISSVARKRAAFETKTDVTRGSQTAARQIEDADNGLPIGLHAAHGAGQVASGNWLGAAKTLYNMKRDLGLRNNPDLNSEMARLLMDHNLPVAGGDGLFPGLPVPKRNANWSAAIAAELAAAEPSFRKHPKP